MKHDCDICRGNGTIRLPVYRSLRFSALPPDNGIIVDAPYRDFPCPECVGTTTDDRVRIFDAVTRIDERYADIGQVRLSAKRDLAFSIAEKMIDTGLLSFTERPVRHELMIEIRAVVGVVSKRFVASMVERIKGRQFEIATRVVQAARVSICNWASRYTGDEGRIGKAQAADYVAAALREVEAEEAQQKASAA